MSRPGRISRLMMPAVLLILINYLVSESYAEETHEALTFRLENDVFTGSDSHYTNGLSLTWSSAQLQSYSDNGLLRNFTRLFGRLPGFSPGGEHDYLVLSLIHEMNTPTDITIVVPPPNEQPYSGVLLLGTTLYSNFPNGHKHGTSGLVLLDQSPEVGRFKLNSMN